MAEAIRYAMIKNEIVENISLWDGDVNRWQPPQDMLVIPAPDNIGVKWRYVNGEFLQPIVEPTPDEPQVI